MANNRIYAKINRLGFQYYDDLDHYDEASLAFWIPKLTAAGTRWLVLPIRESAEIPENFLRRVVEAGIEPIIRVDYSLRNLPPTDIFRERVVYYQSLGVHLVQFFKAPNLKSSWNAADWVKTNPVKRFVEIFRSYAKICVEAKIIPVFPTLAPGGDYPDLAFLSEALKLMKTEGNALISNLFLSADAGFHEHPLDWGKGGPAPDDERILKNDAGQDQRGFRIFEWYNAVAKSVLGRPIPMILTEVGRWTPNSGPFDLIPAQSKKLQTELLRLIQEPHTAANEADQIPAYVIAANFYKLPSELSAGLSLADKIVPSKSILTTIKKGLKEGFALSEPPAGKTIRSAKTIGEELDHGAAVLLHRLFPSLFSADEALVPQLIRLLIAAIRRLIAAVRGKIGSEGYFLIPDFDEELDAAQSHMIDVFVKSTNVRVGRNLNDAIGHRNVILLDDQSLYPSNIISLLQRNQCSIKTLSVANHER